MQFIITGIPIPPSINKQLTVSRGRLIKTVHARRYDQDFAIYFLNNSKLFETYREENKDKDLLYHVKLIFCFERSKLIGQKGQIKALDTNNRIKSAIDKISEALNINDKFFVSDYAEKVIATDGKEQLIAVITPVNLRSSSEIMNTLLERC